MANNWKYKGNSTRPGNPLWDEYINEDTGESTMKEYHLKKSSHFDKCHHYWKLIDSLGNVQCGKCGLGKRIVWGIEFVKNGKIVNKL